MLLKLKYMINAEDWVLVQQTVMANSFEQNIPIELKKYPNVTLAIQFRQKQAKLTADVIAKYNLLKADVASKN